MKHRREDDLGNPSVELSKDFEGLVREVAHGRVTRRHFLYKALAMGASASTIGLVLAACGTEEEGGGATASAQPKITDTTLPKELYIYNWSVYMAPEVKKDFEKEYGVKVVESFFDGNDELIAKIKAGASGYDVIWPSDYRSTILAKTGLIMPLDLSLIPNLKNAVPSLQHPSFDPGPPTAPYKYSVPYMFGTTGLGVRVDKVPEAQAAAEQSWDLLWDTKYKDQISMLAEPREVIAVGLMNLGYSPNTTSQTELDEATQHLVDQKPNVLRYDSATDRRSMVQGVPLVHCWDGDAALASRDAPKDSLVYVLPAQGFMAWADALCIPKTAPSPYAAHLWLNFMGDTEEAAKCANFIGYQTAYEPAAALITDPVQKAMRPTAEVMDKAQFPEDLGEFANAYADAWNTIQAA